MAIQLTVDDLTVFIPDINQAKAEAMIADTLAVAYMVAPPLADADLDPIKANAAKAICRGAVLRWHEAGSGAIQSQSAGVFSMTTDTRQVRYSIFYKTEIEQLKNLCRSNTTGAYGLDTIPWQED